MPETHNLQSVVDAGGSTFFYPALTAIMPQVYGRRFPELQAFSRLPVSPSLGNGAARFIEYEVETEVGRADFINDLSVGGPAVDVASDRVRTPTFQIGNHFTYTDMDVAAAQAAVRGGAVDTRALDARKAIASRRRIETKLDELAWLGDNTRGAVGFMNHPDIPRVQAAGTLAALIATSPDTALAELNEWINGVVDYTNGVETGFSVGMPVAQYNALASTRLSVASDTTILSYWIANNPHVRDVFPLPRLNLAGAGSTDVALAFIRDADKMLLQLVSPYRTKPPETSAYTYKVHAYAVYGAMQVMYPYAASVLEGI